MAMDLWRVGVPTIGETWPARFRSGRSTGGLGTGVYAFRDEWAAKRNESGAGTNDGVFRLEKALTNPIQPQTRDATDALVRFSRVLSLLVENVRTDTVTWDRALDRGSALQFTLTGGLGGTPGVDKGNSFVGSPAREVLFNTPQLRERYGYDEEEFVRDAFEAAREAYKRTETSGNWWTQAGVQPINVLLWPKWDGVCPLDGAGGNTGQHGCVIFKQRIDNCVGRDTDTFEQVPAETLNDCFTEPLQ